MLQEAYQPDGPGQLPPDMTAEGRITLLYKGKGLDRVLPASYRPITLLNTDYKLAARVLAGRCSTTWLTARRLASCHSDGSATTSDPTWRPSLGISTHSSLESFSSWTSRRPLTGWTGLGYSAAWQPQALEQALSAGSPKQYQQTDTGNL